MIDQRKDPYKSMEGKPFTVSTQYFSISGVFREYDKDTHTIIFDKVPTKVSTEKGLEGMLVDNVSVSRQDIITFQELPGKEILDFQAEQLCPFVKYVGDYVNVQKNGSAVSGKLHKVYNDVCELLPYIGSDLKTDKFLLIEEGLPQTIRGFSGIVPLQGGKEALKKMIIKINKEHEKTNKRGRDT